MELNGTIPYRYDGLRAKGNIAMPWPSEKRAFLDRSELALRVKETAERYGEDLNYCRLVS